jgi:hypothetical protein
MRRHASLSIGATRKRHTTRGAISPVTSSAGCAERGPSCNEVATREMPERSLLCLKRQVDEQGQWAFGKEFIAILRERPLPKVEGRQGAFFCIYWSHPSADGDGLIEWCRPVLDAEANALAEHYPS